MDRKTFNKLLKLMIACLVALMISACALPLGGNKDQTRASVFVKE